MNKHFEGEMAIKHAGDGGEFWESKSCDAQNKTKFMSKRILTPPMILMTMVRMILDWIKKWKNPLEGL